MWHHHHHHATIRFQRSYYVHMYVLCCDHFNSKVYIIQEIAECFCKKGPSTWMLVWLQHEKDCFDNPTTYLPYMEGKAMVVALPSMIIWKVKLIPSFIANILQSPVQVHLLCLVCLVCCIISQLLYCHIRLCMWSATWPLELSRLHAWTDLSIQGTCTNKIVAVWDFK